jgi:hypothetical protein
MQQHCSSSSSSTAVHCTEHAAAESNMQKYPLWRLPSARNPTQQKINSQHTRTPPRKRFTALQTDGS